VRAAPTQEAAAEALGQPFSTYRRYLAKAVDQLTDILWAAEIGTLDLHRPKMSID
jgi:DNA primase